MNHGEWVKGTVNILLQAFVCFVVITGTVQLFNDIYFKVIFGIVAGVIEVYVQYLIAQAKRDWRESHLWTSIAKTVFCLAYIGIFGINFSVGIVIQQIAVQEKRAQHIETVSKWQENRIAEIDKLIASKTILLDKETVTGRGPKYEETNNDVKELNKERAVLIAELKQSPEEVSHSIGMFTFLGSIYRKSEEFVKWFLYLFFTLCVYIILWHSSITLKTKKPLQNETDNETDNEMSGKKAFQNGQMQCPECEKWFIPTRKDQIYDDDNCKLRAYRRKKREEEALKKVRES
jgi:hypothetical protein